MNNLIHGGLTIKSEFLRVFKAADRTLLVKVSIFLSLTILLWPMAGITQTGQGSDEAMFIDSSGHVGIGTNTPQARLEVDGDTKIKDQLEIGGNTKIGGQLDVKGHVKIDENLDVSGNTQMQGKMSYRARYQRDDEPESSYEISPRYHLSLTAANYEGRTKTIPQETLEALCADWDGCQVRLAMTRWTSDAETESASVFFTFYYSAPDGHWRASEPRPTKNVGIGIDSDGRTTHVREIWQTCYFTDGTYSNYKDSGDSKKGMQLLVWNKYKHINRTCECTIID